MYKITLFGSPFLKLPHVNCTLHIYHITHDCIADVSFCLFYPISEDKYLSGVLYKHKLPIRK